MAQVKTPFNLNLLVPTTDLLARVPRITSTETYDGAKTQLHDKGLFSTVLFGGIGTDTRDYTFGYIKLNTKILHPLVCDWLKKIKRLHEGIWNGTAYAIFDEQAGEFIEADVESGQTGYHFFVSHLPKLKLKRNKSIKRGVVVDNLEKYRDKYFLENHLVLPAGLRDLQIEQSGKVTEDEINEYYRNLIRLSNSLENLPKKESPEYDQIRRNMQLNANQIYEYIKGILSGKKGFILAKWSSRKIHLASRNVLSIQDPSPAVLGAKNSYTVDTIVEGIFQVMVSNKSSVVSLVRQFPIIQHAFPTISGYANLVDPATLVSKQVQVEDEQIQRWTTIEGIEKLIEGFEKTSVRHIPAMVNGHYLGLIYHDDKKYQILKDITELPEGWDKHHVYPLTYMDIFYLSIQETLGKTQAQVTRYPITGDGSIYIGEIYMKTTTKGLTLREYIGGEKSENIVYEYPNYQSLTYVQTTAPSSTRLGGLGADSDGDTLSANPVLTEEARRQNQLLAGKASSIIGLGGKLDYDIGFEIATRAIKGMTVAMDPKKANRSSREGGPKA